jgi:hypothetical protein
MQEIVNQEFDKTLIEKFIDEIEQYQSNHYGSYNRYRLVKAYRALPDYFKKAISPTRYKNYWRGADGVTDSVAISFTDKRANAGFYGHYAIPISELQSWTGMIDTHRLRVFIDRYKIRTDVGDDENEIVVIEPVWKPGIDDREENYVYVRD